MIRIRTPTAVPRKNRVMHRVPKLLESEAKKPNTEVKNRVRLNAVLRPSRSEPN